MAVGELSDFLSSLKRRQVCTLLNGLVISIWKSTHFNREIAAIKWKFYAIIQLEMLLNTIN